MTHHRTTRNVFFHMAAAICILLPTTTSSYASDVRRQGNGSEKVEIYDPYDAYLEEDAKLNIQYQSLARSLDKTSLSILKQSQRNWIRWRDATCNSAQERANRQIGAIGSSVRNDCLTTLTEQRQVELREFLEFPQNAKNKKFGFSRNQEYLDE